MTSNQDHLVQPVVFQQQSYSYQHATPQGMGSWNQQPPNQSVPYTVQYHGDVGAFAEKIGYGNTYPPLQYSNGGSEDFYRPGYQSFQQTNQWNQQQYSQPQYSSQAQYGSYERDVSRGATFNPTAALPPMNRPPPPLKREGVENNFSLSMLENPAQTAAAYTASWVSSTSSIPPDLKDEPEFANVPREDVGNVFNPGNFSEQFGNMSIQDTQLHREEIGQWDVKQMAPNAQWPGLNNNQNDGQHSRIRKQDENRRPRTEAREMTWDERLRKAQVQKDRVEQRQDKSEQGDKVRAAPRSVRGNKGYAGIEGRAEQKNPTDGFNKDWKSEDDAAQQNGDGRKMSALRGKGGAQMHRSFQPQYPSAAPVFPNGQPLMIPPRAGTYMRNVPGPQPQFIAQDERFRNTWLDANAFMQPFAMQFQQPVPYGGNGGFMRGRGRGRGRNGSNYPRREFRKENDKDRKNDAGDSPSIEALDSAESPVLPAEHASVNISA